MNSVRLGGDSDIWTSIDEDTDLGRPRSGNGFAHQLVQFRIRQILLANLNPVDTGSRGVLDKVSKTAPELPAIGDGIEKQGTPVRNDPVIRIPAAADLRGIGWSDSRWHRFYRYRVTDYSLINLPGLAEGCGRRVEMLPGTKRIESSDAAEECSLWY